MCRLSFRCVKQLKCVLLARVMDSDGKWPLCEPLLPWCKPPWWRRRASGWTRSGPCSASSLPPWCWWPISPWWRSSPCKHRHAQTKSQRCHPNQLPHGRGMANSAGESCGFKEHHVLMSLACFMYGFQPLKMTFLGLCKCFICHFWKLFSKKRWIQR